MRPDVDGTRLAASSSRNNWITNGSTTPTYFCLSKYLSRGFSGCNLSKYPETDLLPISRHSRTITSRANYELCGNQRGWLPVIGSLELGCQGTWKGSKEISIWTPIHQRGDLRLAPKIKLLRPKWHNIALSTQGRFKCARQTDRRVFSVRRPWTSLDAKRQESTRHSFRTAIRMARIVNESPHLEDSINK